ncbi:MAG: hypothetical protein AAF085_08705 [Planctomycetota bacterium]
MTTNRNRCAVAWLGALLLCATSAAGEGWQDERYQLSMQSPNDWVAMSPELLARTNAQVSHLTGRGFIGGYSLVESTTLVFPYMLVQFKPYVSLPEQYRPAAKMNERDRLGLIYALVGAFREKGPLTEDIDTPQFIDRFGSSHATLTRHEDDGRFDFTGKIPHEAGTEPIRYHTHGVFGKDGIALVSVFTVEEFGGLGPVIDNEMRSLKFAEGYGADALPDEPPVVTPEPEPESTDKPEAVEPETAEPEPDQADTQETATDETEALADKAETDEAPTLANPSTGEADATALIVILGLLGVFLVAAAFIAWLVAHKKAKAERERRRARRERMQAAQGTTQVEKKPRPAEPIKGRSHGSSDRQRRGRTRS